MSQQNINNQLYYKMTASHSIVTGTPGMIFYVNNAMSFDLVVLTPSSLVSCNTLQIDKISDPTSDICRQSTPPNAASGASTTIWRSTPRHALKLGSMHAVATNAPGHTNQFQIPTLPRSRLSQVKVHSLSWCETVRSYKQSILFEVILTLNDVCSVRKGVKLYKKNYLLVFYANLPPYRCTCN